MSKRWVIMPPLSREVRRGYRELHPVLAQVLHNRGLADYQSAMDFLAGRAVLHDPMKMKGMNIALGRIRWAIRKNEPIVVYGDFDADGVTSTALLIEALRALGARVKPYIPHRVDEGYGLNTPALLNLAKRGVKLVITVDCGVRSIEEVREAQAAGLDIIITDHHSIGEELPPALAVINPKQQDCPYPEDMLAGVGIAYKLADALIRAESANSRQTPSISTEDLIDLVAIGTVADLAPLDRMENRTLVQEGLKVLNKAHRPGVYALLNVAGIEPGNISAMSIGFGIGPRINAAGRLESAMTAYELLSTNSIERAMELAEMLQKLNINRQELTQQAQDEAKYQAETEGDDGLPLIFASAPHFPAGIVGLVAGRLVEDYYRPAVVIEEGEEESRGSCRSIPEFNITEALDECSDLLLRHGGHAQAAGFSIMTANIPAFKEKIMDIATRHLYEQSLEPTLTIDSEVAISQATLDLAHELERLEPTGVSNQPPVFATRRLKVLEARGVGKEGKHLKLRLGDGPISMDGIAFRQGDWINRLPTYVDVAYHLEVNEWNGRINPQMNVLDLKPAG